MEIPPLPDNPEVLAARDAILAQAKEWPLFKLLGLQIEDIRPGWSRGKVAWRPDLVQPAQILHGGITATLIDTGIAYALLLTDAYRNGAGAMVTIDLRIKYLRPVSSGFITCESFIPRVGKQIVHAESIVWNDEGKEVARGDSIYMFVARDRLQK